MVLNLYNTFSKKERRFFAGAVSIFIVSASLWGISVFYNKTVSEPIEGGSYTEAVVGQVAVINPLLASDNNIDHDLIELLFSDVLDLAESITENEDHTTWTIKLNEGAKWSDGEKLTSNDVLFTVRSIQNSAIRSPLYASWQGVVTERIGDHEVRFTLRNPYVFFADNLSRLKIIPEHIFGSIPLENLRLSDYNLEPVSSGPYMFSSFKKKKNGFIEEYKLVENPNYALGPVLIKSFNFKFYEKSADALEAFLRREVQGLGGITENDLSKIKISHQVFKIDSPQYYAIFLNPTISSALRDVDIRTALSLAVDKEKIVKRVFGDQAIVADGPILPFIEGYIPNPELVFDIEKAKELLEESGWKLEGENKVRTKTINGNPARLSFDITVPKVSFLVQTATILKESWATIGVELNPIVLEPDVIARNIVRTRNYQMILFGNILNNNPDTFSFWHSSQRFYPGLNLSLYEDDDVDDLLEAIRQEFDPEIRKTLTAEFQEIIRESQPAIFLYSPYYIYVGPKNLGGLSDRPVVIPSDRFDNAEKWYLKTARIFK